MIQMGKIDLESPLLSQLEGMAQEEDQSEHGSSRLMKLQEVPQEIILTSE